MKIQAPRVQRIESTGESPEQQDESRKVPFKTDVQAQSQHYAGCFMLKGYNFVCECSWQPGISQTCWRQKRRRSITSDTAPKCGAVTMIDEVFEAGAIMKYLFMLMVFLPVAAFAKNYRIVTEAEASDFLNQADVSQRNVPHGVQLIDLERAMIQGEKINSGGCSYNNSSLLNEKTQRYVIEVAKNLETCESLVELGNLPDE
ncbi:hypothetical protein [Photobacterium sp. 1_MG-2023]|uniref:hypothetical protein n=1 Tax=Photobacterium sp. 1_MG-2023 TaxID=3062646 RepID=UPI0026E46630|nr:hypothetical protein [Photobacterium sp. 1_MG-2023]MDO6706955.1 hypothetical protein [Photobacterium sp. 1_MG-2023]